MPSVASLVYAGQNTSRPPEVINGLELYGHSYFDFPATGTYVGASAINDNFNFGYVFATSIGLQKNLVRNHAITGASLTAVGRAAGGFARALAEITKPVVTYPFTRSGGAYLLCWGINDIGNNTPANQALMNSTYNLCLTAVVSKARASAIYLANSGTQWTLGTNFSASPTASADFTSGNAVQATVVDSAGTSTATFTIPLGYQGEPICFNLVGTSGAATGCIVTWGGTVTGTTGIVGTTTNLNSVSIDTQCAYPVRYTAAANGLSASNAGQTISLKITTIAGGKLTLDGAWIESLKPTPVIVCNVARLPERSILYAFGDGVTTGVNTSFTSATASFATSTDAGVAIVETDAQGAFGAGLTVSSVTNATTIVLSGNAAAAKTSIKFTLARKLLGYSGGNYATNTDFTGATIANHANADAAVATLNATTATVVAKFDSMVQIADIDTALGLGDTVHPANVYSWFVPDQLHYSSQGAQQMAQAVWAACAALRQAPDLQPLGTLEVAASPIIYTGPDRRIVRDSQAYLPEYTQISVTSGAVYSALAGDMFALPFFVTEATQLWGQIWVQQVNAPATSGSNARAGWYDDPNNTGYPQCLRVEVTSGGAVALGTTAGQKNLGLINRAVHYGMNWLVLKIDSLGTTKSQLASILGPNRYMPNWTPTSGTGAAQPIAWLVAGVSAGALPTIFPSGATLAPPINAITSAVGAVPAVGVFVNIQ